MFKKFVKAFIDIAVILPKWENTINSYVFNIIQPALLTFWASTRNQW